MLRKFLGIELSLIEDGCLSKVTGGRAPYFGDLIFGGSRSSPLQRSGENAEGASVTKR
jgi:hypothetical protein